MSPLIQANTLYPVPMAEARAAEMQTYDDMGWTYKAEVITVADVASATSAYAVIAVYDDEGVLAGYF